MQKSPDLSRKLRILKWKLQFGKFRGENYRKITKLTQKGVDKVRGGV